jgi:hypothetical protein
MENGPRGGERDTAALGSCSARLIARWGHESHFVFAPTPRGQDPIPGGVVVLDRSTEALRDRRRGPTQRTDVGPIRKSDTEGGMGTNWVATMP